MSEELKTAARYRLLADKLRAIAKADRVRETRRVLLNVAKNYDHLAERIEAYDKTNKAPRRPRS